MFTEEHRRGHFSIQRTSPHYNEGALWVNTTVKPESASHSWKPHNLFQSVCFRFIKPETSQSLFINQSIWSDRSDVTPGDVWLLSAQCAEQTGDRFQRWEIPWKETVLPYSKFGNFKLFLPPPPNIVVYESLAMPWHFQSGWYFWTIQANLHLIALPHLIRLLLMFHSAECQIQCPITH